MDTDLLSCMFTIATKENIPVANHKFLVVSKTRWPEHLFLQIHRVKLIIMKSYKIRLIESPDK
jgi:hypothetical protein